MAAGSIAGETIWITGAGSGIGQACALAFAAVGCRLALTGRREGPLEDTAAAIRGSGGEAFVAVADVANPQAVGDAHRAIVAALGDPLVLINSAGGNAKRRHWKDLSPSDMSAVIDQDLKSAFYCTLAVLPAMRERRDGRIVHIASQAGVSLQPITGPSYSASKHAIVAMSASLNAEEGIHGVRSICISPGEVETPILDTRPSPPTREERRLMLQPEDVAQAALFCVSLPARACVTEMILLPTDDRLARAQARLIEAL
ncbi:MAG: SDR family oxidoreductase [Hyphomicrobiales bacterium]|nr:SDR family oxidoreductase [Hyphomicrobiales bacterium]MBV8441918.1 SDR family oxidoreductase [Hyphomicrobiales bacterium]